MLFNEEKQWFNYFMAAATSNIKKTKGVLSFVFHNHYLREIMSWSLIG